MGDDRRGFLSGVGAYGLWGVLPLYFRLVDDVEPAEILLHRIVWSLVVVGAILTLRRRWREVGEVRRDGRRARLLALAAVLISANWLTYIWAVNNDHVLDAALGYYINPLITVAIGVAVLGERLRRAQVVALALGAAAVVVLTVAYGSVPWIGLTLATTFAVYGLCKKSAGVLPLPSLAFETAVLAPFALVGIGVLVAADDLALGAGDLGRDVLLLGLGVVTATPLLLFANAANRVPLTTLGLLQYLAPTLQLLCGVLVLGEALPPERLAGFVLVWLALLVLASDAVGTERRARRAALALSLE